MSFLERPFHPTTLTSMVRAAVRGRRRQYEARLRLEEIGERQAASANGADGGRLGSWTFDVERMMFHSLGDLAQALRAGIRRASSPTRHSAQSVHPEDRNRLLAGCCSTLLAHWRRLRHRIPQHPAGPIRALGRRPRAAPSRTPGAESTAWSACRRTSPSARTRRLERERLLGELASERDGVVEVDAHPRASASRSGPAELATEIAARERAQEQLLQSQKMESVGQLTGGIAHDFNNLLMAVIGNLEMLRKRAAGRSRHPAPDRRGDTGRERGASLTQRMLAFASQQDLKMRVGGSRRAGGRHAASS